MSREMEIARLAQVSYERGFKDGSDFAARLAPRAATVEPVVSPPAAPTPSTCAAPARRIDAALLARLPVIVQGALMRHLGLAFDTPARASLRLGRQVLDEVITANDLLAALLGADLTGLKPAEAATTAASVDGLESAEASVLVFSVAHGARGDFLLRFALSGAGRTLREEHFVDLLERAPFTNGAPVQLRITRPAAPEKPPAQIRRETDTRVARAWPPDE